MAANGIRSRLFFWLSSFLLVALPVAVTCGAPPTDRDGATGSTAEAPPTDSPDPVRPPAEGSSDQGPGKTQPVETGVAGAGGTQQTGANGPSPSDRPAPKTAKPETRLRFSFRFQRWIDVLEWLAREADLSLVLDAPPPGTFNFTDTREYTPLEAIDLVNGVLLTKQYTLVRREGMLLLVDLKEGIPQGLVPRVGLEELEQRGKFELVSVLFPLGKRSGTAVEAEIGPLLGPNGKVVSLPATKQLMVTDTAGVMRAIGAVIESIPEPPATAVAEGPPVLETHPLKKADSKVALDVLGTLVPGAKLVLDEKAERLHVSAPPSQQALVKEVLQQMQADRPADQQPVLETYPVAEDGQAELVATLQTMVPDARLTMNPKTGMLAAWCSATEQETIKAAVEKLQGERTPGQTRQMEVHKLSYADPDTVRELFQTILPNAKVWVDEKSEILVSVAVPADQLIIRSTLARLQPGGESTPAQEAQFYPLASARPSTVLAAIKKSIPDALVAMEAVGDRLMVVASERDQKRAAKLIQKLENAAFVEGRSKLKVYPVTLPQQKRFQAVLDSLEKELVGIKIIENAEPGELSIWAKERQHVLLDELLEELKREVPAEEKFGLTAYPIESTDPDSVLSALQEVFPDTKLILGDQGKRLLVWTFPKRHADIKAALEELQSEKAGPDARVLRAYPISKADPAVAMGILQELLPSAKLQRDETAGTIVAWARPEDHETIKQVLEQMQVKGVGDNRPCLEVYPVGGADVARLLKILQPLAPEAQLTVDDASGKLAAWATPEQHAAIKEAVQKLGTSLDQTEQLGIYPLNKADPETTLTLLATLVPRARLSVDPKTRNLIAVATMADHGTIKGALEQADEAASKGSKNEFVAHPVTSTEPEIVLELMKNLFPDAVFVFDQKARRLLVRASLEEQVAITAALAKLESVGPPMGKEMLDVYQMTSADPDSLLTVMQSLFPDAQFVMDPKTRRLAVRAKPERQAAIKSAFEKMDTGAGGDVQEKFKVYPIKNVDPSVGIEMLQELLPDVRFGQDATAGTIIAFGRESDHKLIADTLDQMQAGAAAKGKQRLEVYTIGKTDPYTLRYLFQELVPEARTYADTKSGKLSVLGTEEDHKIVRAAVAQITAKEPDATAPTVVVYRLGDAGQTSTYYTLRLLREAVPEATFTFGPDGRRLIAWARAADHKTIQAVVDKLTEEDSPESAPKAVVYTLEFADVDTIESILRRAVPEARVADDEQTGKLLVWARPKEHKIIKEIVDQMDVEPRPGEKSTVAVYTVEGPGQRPSYYAYRMVREAVPAATCTLGADPNQLVVWGTPKDHETIVALIEKMAEKAPPELAPKAVVYSLKSTTAVRLLPVLEAAAPEAEFTEGPDAQTLVVLARPPEHEMIKGIIDRVDVAQPPELASRAAVYTLKSVTAETVVPVLEAAVPEAKFTAGDDPSQIVAWASPADHAVIQGVVEKVDVARPADSAAKATVYTLESTSAAGAVEFLQTAVPEAVFSLGADPQKFIAWARPADHATIGGIVEKIDVAEPADTASTAVVYTLETISTASALPVLKTAVPQAAFASGDDPRQLIAWARPAGHAVIKNAIEQMNRVRAEETGKVVTYRLETTGAANAMEVLSAALPEVQFAVGADPNRLIAYARPVDHEVIKAAVEQLEADGFADAQRQLAVYPMKNKDAAALIEVLDESLKEKAKFVADANRDSLIVWADAKHQEAIKTVVQQFMEQLPKVADPTSRVYRLRRADPAAASSVLSVLVPEAEIALDKSNRSLVVGALPEAHERIKAMIEEMDREDAERDPQLRVHTVTTADPVSLLTALKTFFDEHPDVQLSLDQQNGAVIAVATPSQHATIGELIEKVELTTRADADAKLELYSLQNVDSYALLEVLDMLLHKQGAKADLSVDTLSGQLMAIAGPEQHDLIRQTIEKMRTAERSLEIFQLDFVEPATAKLAISTMFRGEGASTPDVDSDEETGQLFVRAGKEQLARVRQLLIKMGETGLGSVQLGTGSRLRVIPFEGDARALVEEIQKVWPHLRKNPIRVTTPTPTTERPSETPSKKNGPTTPKSPKAPTPDPTGAPGDKGEPGTGATPREAPPKTDRPDHAPSADQQTSPANDGSQEPDESLPPVVVMFGEGSVTIASEDPEALDQFESLLRTLSSRVGYADRYYSIFKVKHVSATEIAGTLTELFRSSIAPTDRAGRWQQGPGFRTTAAGRDRTTSRIVIVPNERLNTILVQGSRMDRAKIERLLKVLDTAEVPATLAAKKPRLIPIKNARASRIEQLLRQVFQARLAPAAGASRTVSTASRSVPLLTVDEPTNTLIVVAPAPLIDDITELATALDENFGNEPARSVKIISLKKASAARVQSALDAIIKGTAGTARAPTRTTRP